MADHNPRLKDDQFSYSKIISKARDAIIMVNEDGNICLWNEAATRIFGFAESDVLGKNLHNIISPSRYHKAQTKGFDTFTKCGKGAAIGKTLELFGVNKDGEEFPIELSLSSLDINGHWHAVGFIRDISKRNKAELELRNSEDKYQSLVDNLVMGVSVINSDMEVVSLNKQMKQWFPFVDVEDKPKCYEVFNNPARNEICDYCPTCKTLKDGKVHESITSTPLGNEIKNYRVISAPLKKQNGEIIGVIESVEDITERLQYEKEVAKTEKLESLALLAGGIAHDFNNMLTSLMGNVSLAKYQINEDTDIHKFLTNAENACNRAKDLTSQLLTFSKGGAPIKESATINELIHETTSFSMIGTNIKAEFEIDENLNAVEIDKGQISQVISNLVINARQAMPDGGIIKIKAGNVSINHDNLYDLLEGDYIKISISDNGHGIPKDIIDKIFDPFFTTKAKGSGLGLATCHSIIKKHDGHLYVVAEESRGTTFHILLPATSNNVFTNDTEENIAISGAGRILVMDDDATIQQLAKDVLKTFGYQVSISSDGEEAIRLFSEAQDNNEPFDAVILDLTVQGGMGGIECMDQIRRINPDVPTIVCSGYSNDSIMTEYKTYGFSATISKPFTVHELSNAVNKALCEEKEVLAV